MLRDSEGVRLVKGCSTGKEVDRGVMKKVEKDGRVSTIESQWHHVACDFEIEHDDWGRLFGPVSYCWANTDSALVIAYVTSNAQQVLLKVSRKI